MRSSAPGLGRPAAHIANPLSRIGALSRESVDSMGDMIWALDPTRDTPGHLLQRLRRVAHERLKSAASTCASNQRATPAPISMPTYSVRCS